MMDNGQRFHALMARYNELGQLLNDEPDLDEATQVAEAKMIVDEMAKKKPKLTRCCPIL